jgi:cell wall-associated NlpC family hydrolase
MTVTAAQFLAMAMKQNGKPYRFGWETRAGDPDPEALDCSELIQHTGSMFGMTIPDGAVNQYPWIEKAGLAISPKKALLIPGAVLFKHGPGRHAPIYHVGFSMGDGHRTFEAKGSAYGVGIFEAGTVAESPAERESCWNLAGLIPGIDYSGHGGMNLGLVLFALALFM